MMWSIIGIIVAIYIGLTLIMFLLQDYFIYFPTQEMMATPATIGLAYEEVLFETADGIKLSGWYVPVIEAKNVVIFFHGNAGNISHRLESIALFHRLGLNVLIFDYRGYGLSQGTISEQGIYLDAEAVFAYLVQERGFKPEQIIIFGRSLGGAVATWLAQKHPPQALILESTFTSIPDMGARQFPFLPVRLLARNQYNTINRLPHLSAPILIIHSPDDELIPYSHAQTLFKVAPEPKTFLEIRGGHNEGFVISTNYETGLRDFLAQHISF